MAERLNAALQSILTSQAIGVTDLVRNSSLQRLSEGLLTRDENPLTHFCVYFAAVDPQVNEIFIGHHKKSGLWLFNGGHIDAGEIPQETFFREISEEWGELKKMGVVINEVENPDLITITEIDSVKQTCKRHYDLWYFVKVDKDSFNPDQEKLAKEFYETRWVNSTQARELITDPNTFEAINYLKLKTSPR